MNKDEMKMIRDMRAIIQREYSDCMSNLCSNCEYYAMNYCGSVKKANALYNAGYRKVADDEIVVKKSEYEELKTHIEDLQTKLGAVMLCIKNTHEIDISDLLRKQEQETAREIIDKIENLADIEIKKDGNCEKYFDMVLDLLDKELE